MTGHYPPREPDEYDDYPTRRAPAAYRDPADPYVVSEDHYAAEVEILRRRVILSRVSNIVWSITGFIVGLIAVRIVLRMIAANESNAFVSLVYSWSEFFVRPFMGIVQDPDGNGAVLEINSLIAIMVYVLLTFLVVRLVWLVLDVTAPTEP